MRRSNEERVCPPVAPCMFHAIYISVCMTNHLCNMKLVSPSIQFKSSVIEAIKEFHTDPEYLSGRYQVFDKFPIEELETDFQKLVQLLEDNAEGKHLPEGYVPVSTYWLIDDDAFIGQVNIRHRLNEHLHTIGGHIGYGIRPSKRNRGYGTKILELALEKAKELGIEKVLVTCDETNIGSKKIIERNGGVYESTEFEIGSKVGKLRYWIMV